MNITEILAIIEDKRQAIGMHKATLCSKASITTTYYNKLLAGQANPSFLILKDLLEAVGGFFMVGFGSVTRI